MSHFAHIFYSHLRIYINNFLVYIICYNTLLLMMAFKKKYIYIKKTSSNILHIASYRHY